MAHSLLEERHDHIHLGGFSVADRIGVGRRQRTAALPAPHDGAEM